MTSLPVPTDIERVLQESEPFDLAELSFGVPDSLDPSVGLTPEQLEELKADPELYSILTSVKEGAAAELADQGNPYKGKDPAELIKIYLDNSIRGVRWLASEAKVSRKKVQAFIEGDASNMDADEFERIVAVINADYAEWSRREAAKGVLIPTETPGIGVDPQTGNIVGTATAAGEFDLEHPKLGKVSVKAVEPPPGLNRQERRKWMADFRAGKIKEPTKPTYPRGQTPYFIHMD